MMVLAWATWWGSRLSVCWVLDLVALNQLSKDLMMVLAWVTWLAGCWVPDLVSLN